MKLAIIGSRNCPQIDIMSHLKHLPTGVVSGGAKGADTGLFTLKGERFNIYGVPFFNRDSNRPEKLQNFEAQLKEITGLTSNPNFM